MALKPDKYFWLSNGKPIKDLNELSEVLKTIPKEVFENHVTKDKNDFSNWIKDVLKSDSLAKEIKDAKTAEKMQKYVDEYLHPLKENAVKEEIIVPILEKPIFIEKIKEKKKPKIKGRMQKKAVILKAEAIEEAKKEEEIKPDSSNFGVQCQLKTFKCGFLEFIFGVIVGLTIAFIVYKLI